MTISGFTMVRNADRYYFPIKASIESILPIVDEFIVALGDNQAGDQTRAIIESIGSDKVKIIDRVWSEEAFVDGRIFAEETSFALSQCSGDWCFYLQADEVVHEQDLPTIIANCKRYQKDDRVDGLLFQYHHFYADYQHYLPFHGWYKNEIRIIKNNRQIYSYKDAQSFRKEDNQYLNVIEIEPYIYHYGWVRPPELMQSKKKEQDSMHHGVQKIHQDYQQKALQFDYGALGKLPVFQGTHPAVMHDFIQKFHWKDQLNYSKKATLYRPKMKHEKLKYRVLTLLENWFNGGKDLFGYSNWNRVK